ncbi:TfoX/Sxy family protein [Bacillus massiliigorillae]|uniref:TfoX/Sxy family protein n=1 Tax=Bacillus massiliigorillae TaxID=1243664 RepID=UPI0003A28134|nr:TfoX/Sxy family protein [Bacillus massiliigorillae]
MTALQELPNIGKVVASQLNEVGIHTSEELTEVGSKEAFTRIKKIDSSACINRLYGLEGAIQGIRWHNLSDGCKKDLKSFMKTI